MPRTKSKLSLSERRSKAFEYFARGHTNRDIAKRLRVSEDTVSSYRRKYEERIHAQAASNPAFLRDVLANTIRSLEELDRIRTDAWDRLETRRSTEEVICPHCESTFDVEIDDRVSDDSRVKYQNVLLKAQEQRAKLFGVLGIKADLLAAMLQIKSVQDRILDFMREELCPEDRAALERFLMGPEMATYVQSAREGPVAALDVVDAELVEEAS